jgi:hypothetical protein
MERITRATPSPPCRHGPVGLLSGRLFGNRFIRKSIESVCGPNGPERQLPRGSVSLSRFPALACILFSAKVRRRSTVLFPGAESLTPSHRNPDAMSKVLRALGWPGTLLRPWAGQAGPRATSALLGARRAGGSSPASWVRRGHPARPWTRARPCARNKMGRSKGGNWTGPERLFPVRGYPRAVRARVASVLAT